MINQFVVVGVVVVDLLGDTKNRNTTTNSRPSTNGQLVQTNKQTNKSSAGLG